MILEKLFIIKTLLVKNIRIKLFFFLYQTKLTYNGKFLLSNN